MRRNRVCRALAIGAALAVPLLLSSCQISSHADGCETAAAITADFVIGVFAAIGLAALAIVLLASASQ